MFRFLDISGKCVLACSFALPMFVPFGSAHATTFQVLYDFKGPPDGNVVDDGVVGGLIADRAGDLYGTTQGGGSRGGYCGTIFKLTPDGTETVLHSFGAGSNRGCEPDGGLVADKLGNLYGTTSFGSDKGGSQGVVFKLTPTGEEKVLHVFQGGRDGAQPRGA